MNNQRLSLDNIADKLVRIETVDNDDMNEQMVEQTHAVYPHAVIYGASFTLEKTIEATVDDVFKFLQQTASIEQWSYAYRLDKKTNGDSGVIFFDTVTQQHWHCQITIYAKANVIDLRWHSAVDDSLLIHESIRIIDTQSAFNKPGTVLLWNCSHAPPQNNAKNLSTMPCSDYWQQIPARRKIEINNIKTILEHQANTKAEQRSGAS